jgi:hypothetical protein
VDAVTHDCIQDYVESDSGQGGHFSGAVFYFEVQGETFEASMISLTTLMIGASSPFFTCPKTLTCIFSQAGCRDGISRLAPPKGFLALVLLAMLVGAGVAMVGSGMRSFYRNELDRSD